MPSFKLSQKYQALRLRKYFRSFFDLVRLHFLSAQLVVQIITYTGKPLQIAQSSNSTIQAKVGATTTIPFDFKPDTYLDNFFPFFCFFLHYAQIFQPLKRYRWNFVPRIRDSEGDRTNDHCAARI